MTDVLAESPERQQEKAIEAVLRERGVCMAVFWKNGISTAHRIGPSNIIDASKALLECVESPEEIADRIEAALERELNQSPRQARSEAMLRTPMRSADEVISNSIHDQGRLEVTASVMKSEAPKAEEIFKEPKTKEKTKMPISIRADGFKFHCNACGTGKTSGNGKCPNKQCAKHKGKSIPSARPATVKRSTPIQRISLRQAIEPESETLESLMREYLAIDERKLFLKRRIAELASDEAE